MHIFTAVLFLGFAIKMHMDSKDANDTGCESLDEAKDAVRDTSKRVRLQKHTLNTGFDCLDTRPFFGPRLVIFLL